MLLQLPRELPIEWREVLRRSFANKSSYQLLSLNIASTPTFHGRPPANIRGPSIWSFARATLKMARTQRWGILSLRDEAAHWLGVSDWGGARGTQDGIKQSQSEAVVLLSLPFKSNARVLRCTLGNVA